MALTKSQKLAVAQFEKILNEYMTKTSVEKYGNAITKFEVQELSNGDIVIEAETELTGLPFGNALRSMDHRHWLVFVGKRGGMTATIYPESLNQFKGSKAFGINIK